jgi:DNA-binding transcriptional MerR regulator
MRIGEVHSLLRQDNPNIELSKIRYYEDKGLVQPARSRKGYRLYSERDVSCLREAIRLAQEEFVPLRVVRVRLIEQGLLDDEPTSPSVRQVAREAGAKAVSIPVPTSTSAPDPTAPPTLKVVPAKSEGLASAEPAPSDAEAQYWPVKVFLKMTGLDLAVVNQLQLAGLLAPVTIAREMAFSALDVRVAEALSGLLARDIDIRLLGSLRRNVEREIGVIDDLTQPLRVRVRHVRAREVNDVAASVAADVAAVRSILMERALSEYLGS